ncbi:MAG: hypothetical protein GY820_36370 [Gammaproteobacteria bacterium]|nr:hypothetical protein [Gammaproteobacteria bacterium]
MAHLKTEHIHACVKGNHKTIPTKIMVNAGGEFYCNVPEYLYGSTLGVRTLFRRHQDKYKVFAKSLDDLVSGIEQALRDYLDPTTTEENVILYNIESHISFAENPDGDVFPNASFEGAEWRHHDDERYGGHSASNLAKNGYSLIIGAKAMTKTTHVHNDFEKVEYLPYCMKGIHLESDRPARLLNSWCGFALPKDAKEIPYTDEAALFFHDLMLGMARLSQAIQGHVFDQQDLLNVINDGVKLLGGQDDRTN